MEVAKDIVATITDPHTMVGPEVCFMQCFIIYICE